MIKWCLGMGALFFFGGGSEALVGLGLQLNTLLIIYPSNGAGFWILSFNLWFVGAALRAGN